MILKAFHAHEVFIFTFFQECESSDVSDRTIAYGVAGKILPTVSGEAASQVISGYFFRFNLL